MKILERYIGQAVIFGVLSVLAVLLALFALIAFVNEFSAIGMADYTIWHALLYTLLMLPVRMYEIFPMATLLGTMLGLGVLAANRELVVVRGAGVSINRVVWAIMKTALMLMLLAMVIGEVIAPPVQKFATEKRLQLINVGISLNTDYGLWARDGDIYIHVRQVERDGQLQDINLYTLRDQQLQAWLRAESATYDGRQWLLRKVTRNELAADELQQRYYETLPWNTLLDPGLISVVSVEPESLAVWRLYSYIQYLRSNGLESAQYELAMWNKLIMPLTIGAMVLLAVPFVFGSQRQASIGRQIMLGFLLGIGFYIGNRLAGQMGLVYNFSPWLSAALPTLLIIVIGSLLLRRLR